MELTQWLNDRKIVGLDTNCFIYYFEGNKAYENVLEKIFSAIENGKCKGITSVISITEIIIHPLRKEELNLAKQYKYVLYTFPNLLVQEINHEIAYYAGLLRAGYNIRTPDALQIASAILNNADIFITNDTKLRKVKEIEVVLLSELSATNK